MDESSRSTAQPPPRPPPDAATPSTTPTAKRGLASTPAAAYASPAAHLCSIGWQPSWVRESATSLGGDISLRLPSWRRSSASASGLSPSTYEPITRPSASSFSSALPPPPFCREHSHIGWQPTWVREESASRASIAEASSGWQPTVLAANFAAVAATAADTHAEDERRTSLSRHSSTQKLADSAGKFVRNFSSSLTSTANRPTLHAEL